MEKWPRYMKILHLLFHRIWKNFILVWNVLLCICKRMRSRILTILQFKSMYYTTIFTADTTILLFFVAAAISALILIMIKKIVDIPHSMWHTKDFSVSSKMVVVGYGGLRNTHKIVTQCQYGWAPKNSGCQCTLIHTHF